MWADAPACQHWRDVARRCAAMAQQARRLVHTALDVHALICLPTQPQVEVTRIIPAARLQKATFGCGCFWCVA